MPYQIAESGALIANASNYVIADEARVENPDYRVLDMGGGASVVYENMGVSAGGTATLANYTKLSGGVVDSGGSLNIGLSATVSGLTIRSGGWAKGVGNFPNISAITLESGAYLYIGNGCIY
ncbi:MAG: hypothetical protein IJJ28_08610, partial [Lentisphaeria bacterium]|nr:hypothetical protein [Lentisphaeria bacterium]